MKEETDEAKKFELYDKHIAQKMLDQRPANTLQVRMSQMFKSVCKNWVDEDEKETEKKVKFEQENEVIESPE